MNRKELGVRHCSYMKTCSFGSFNTKTGESQDGYIDKKGEMNFKKLPWYIRLFCEEPIETVFIDVVTTNHSLFNKRTGEIRPMGEARGSLYKKWNPYTGKIYRLFARFNGDEQNYSIDAYVAGHGLIND